MTHSNTPSSSAKSKPWKIDLIVLIILALLTTLVFWNTSLDLDISKQFYTPENPADNWPAKEHPFWGGLYDSAPVIMWSWMLSCIFILLFIKKTSTEKKRLRLYSVYLILIVVLGPGLVINGVLKGYASRPRPADTIPLGGTQQYVPPLQLGNSLLFKSFPSGHAASAFVFVGFFFVFRGRRKKLALIALSGSIFFGLLMGTARIMQGGHFLSDVIWAGIITYLTALIVYYFILRVPMREEVIESGDTTKFEPFSRKTKAAFTAVILSMLTANLIALPYAEKVNHQVSSEMVNAQTVLSYEFDLGDITVNVNNSSDKVLTVTGLADGYGFPTSHVKTAVYRKGDNYLNAFLLHKGIYAELISKYNLEINLDKISTLNLTTQKGTITVNGQLTEGQKAKLNLKANGEDIIWK